MTAYVRAYFHRRRVAFALTNTVATALSLAMFSCALAAGLRPHTATALRLLIALPVLYVGYSRYMLADVLREERTLAGRTRAEARMLARVGIAIATAMGLELAIEPVLATWLFEGFGHRAATLAPLAAGLGYGPVATYILLASAARAQPALRLA